MADLALINGVIYTGDPKQPRVEAVATAGEKIIATGSTAEIRKLIGANTRVIDLHGGFAMPGFNDAHLHLGSAAQAKLSVDLEGANSLGEFQKRIRDRVAKSKPGEWIVGAGWDHTLWSPANFPTRADLDSISGDHPMFFSHISGHVAVANSKALEIAGITASTPNPPGRGNRKRRRWQARRNVERRRGAKFGDAKNSVADCGPEAPWTRSGVSRSRVSWRHLRAR